MAWELIPATGPDGLQRYAAIASKIAVETVLGVEPLAGGAAGLALHERIVEQPYVKDYDAGGGPTLWAERFDIGEWEIVLVVDGKRVLGGAAAWPGLPGDPSTVATLWDIRVQPYARRTGLGTLLLNHQRARAKERGFRWLKAETQNVNVAACRFYQREGGVLGAINRFAYTGQPGIEHEVELDWYFDLSI